MIRNRSHEIEIRLTPHEWIRLQGALVGPRSDAITSRITHSLGSMRRAPNGTLSLIFSPQDGTIVTQALHLLLAEGADGSRGLVEWQPLPQALRTTSPDPGSRCQAYLLTAGLPRDTTNRCTLRATRQLQVRHCGEPLVLDLCGQHSRQITHRARPLYFVVAIDLIGIGHPM